MSTDFQPIEGGRSVFKKASRFQRIFIILAVIIAGLILVVNTVGIVQPGHVGIFITAGSVSNSVKGEGLYFKIPFVQSVVEMDSRTRKVEWTNTATPLTAASKDLQDVYILAVATFHITPSKGAKIFKTIGMDYSEKKVEPLTINAIKTHTAKYNVAEILQNREKITRDVNDDLRNQLASYDIVVENVSLVNIDFRPEYKQAIEQKQIAEKQVETQRFTLEKQALEAQQQVKKAEADKQAKILAAQAEKEAKILEGEGVEEFNKKVSQGITDELIKYKSLQNQEKAIEAWDGKYPDVVAGDGAMPLIQVPGVDKDTNTKSQTP